MFHSELTFLNIERNCSLLFNDVRYQDNIISYWGYA
jgi:hypothetical protein